MEDFVEVFPCPYAEFLGRYDKVSPLRGGLRSRVVRIDGCEVIR